MERAPGRPVVEGGLLTAVAVIAAFISVSVPVIGSIAKLFLPVPIILLGVRHGHKWSILAAVVSGLLIGLLMHPFTAVMIAGPLIPVGIVLGYAIRAGFTPTQTLLFGVAASLVAQVAVVAVTVVIMGINLLTILNESMTQSYDMVMDFHRSQGMNAEDLVKMEIATRFSMNFLKVTLPSSVFLGGAFVVTYLNFQAAKIALKRLGQQIDSFPPFSRWSVPQITVHALALALVAMYWGQSRTIELLYNAGLNLLVITCTALFIQGMAVFYFLADKYNLSRMVRSIILFLILTNLAFILSLIIFGAFDLFFDYRQLRAPRLE